MVKLVNARTNNEQYFLELLILELLIVINY